jgi:RNA polymerase sigma-70 factor (ECF subfamily)
MILGAADGCAVDLDRFVERYGPIVQSYLRARWPGPPGREWIDDASQEVFVECFKEGGVLVRAVTKRSADDLPSFRKFLNGVLRNVARRFECGRPVLGFDSAFDCRLASEEDGPDQAFDRAWAESILREAAERQAQRARSMGQEAQRRVELLDRHFNGHEAVADIARPWGMDSKAAHRFFALAREEFREALQEVLCIHYPGTRPSTQREAAKLLSALTARAS